MVLGIGLAGAVLTTITAKTEALGVGPQVALFNAVSVALLVATGVAALGVVTSATRGS
jgi:hypothetical protein